MYEESIRQEFRLKNRDETRNYLIEEIDQNELMCKKHRNVCRVLNYIDHLLILDQLQFRKKKQEPLVYLKNNLIDIDGSIYIRVVSLIEINNITTVSNNITLRKVNVKPYGFNKMYMNKDLIDDKLYQLIIDQFNERKVTSTKFRSVLLNKIKSIS